MDDKAFIRAITRFRSGDQYLEMYIGSYVKFVNTIFMTNILCNFENSEKSESSETRETEGAGSWFKVDPKHFKDGSKDDDAVKFVES